MNIRMETEAANTLTSVPLYVLLGLIAIIGYFLRRTLSQMDKKLDRIEPLPVQIAELRVRVQQLEQRMNRLDGLEAPRS